MNTPTIFETLNIESAMIYIIAFSIGGYLGLLIKRARIRRRVKRDSLLSPLDLLKRDWERKLLLRQYEKNVRIVITFLFIIILFIASIFLAYAVFSFLICL